MPDAMHFREILKHRSYSSIRSLQSITERKHPKAQRQDVRLNLCEQLHGPKVVPQNSPLVRYKNRIAWESARTIESGLELQARGSGLWCLVLME